MTTSGANLIDRREREEIRNNLDESFLVEAAAGTGKTTVLVDRLVALLQSGRTSVDRVVAVTFTRKAAGELKLRLRQGLERARQNTSETAIRENIEAAIASLEEARVGTIHSFCAEILRERPVEAGVDPDFRELSEDEAPRLFKQVFKTWIERKLNEMPEALSRALARISTRGGDRIAPLERLRTEAWKLAERRDFPEPWEKRPFDRKQEITDILEKAGEVAEASEQCPNHRDNLRIDLEPLRRFIDNHRRSLDLKPSGTLSSGDYDELEAHLSGELLRDLTRRSRKGHGKFSKGMSRPEALQRRDHLIEMLGDFKQRADADLAASLRLVLESAVGEYVEVKKQQGRVDFVDLLLMVRGVLRDYPEVREHLNERFTHIFVDEFQDTDPLQVEILLLLSASNVEEDNWRRVQIAKGKLFIVGDPKQSIYRFRRADVQLYEEVKGIVRGSGVRLLHLQTNFRSVAPLQRAINASFEEVFDGDTERIQPLYVPLRSPLESEPVIPISSVGEGPPELIALPVPEPRIWRGQVTHKSFHSSFPDAAAAFIDWLLRTQPWQLDDPEKPGAKTGIEARHITFLFRRFISGDRDITRPYIRALDARRIPHLLVGSRTFHQREEVESIRAALTAVEWPDDELNVFATLRGSLFAVEDSLLLEFRKRVGNLHPFRELDEATRKEFKRIVPILDLLADLHYSRNHRPIVDTINRILEFCRAHAGLALRPTGEQVLANVQKICDLARSFELTGGLSFRGFVDFLVEESEKPRSADSPVLEEAADGVRLMTLHAAKGLEAPIVVLADIMARIAAPNPSQHVDQQKRLCAQPVLFCQPWELVQNRQLEFGKDVAEGERIAYVAATRAREMLIVPALGIGPDYYKGGWISPLNPAVYPARESWYEPAPPPAGCPEFGSRTAVIPPSNRDGVGLPMIKPGLHRPMKGTHRVLWWDPTILQLNAVPDLGLRDEEVLIYDEAGSTEGWDRYESWKTQREEALQSGARASLSIIRPSEVDSPPPRLYEVEIHELATGGSSFPGKRFGVLVHTLLRDAPFLAGLEELDRLARFHGRIMRATEQETEGAVRTVHRVLQNPLVRRAPEAERFLREYPITHRLDANQLVEGTIDLAYRDSGTWTLIDFKTTAEFEDHLSEYRNQIQWYALALEEATGCKVRPCLLRIQ